MRTAAKHCAAIPGPSARSAIECVRPATSDGVQLWRKLAPKRAQYTPQTQAPDTRGARGRCGRGGCAILSHLSWAQIEDLSRTVEASMRYVLRLLAFFAAFVVSSAHASDRIRLAQAVPGQVAPQGQVLPAPLPPTPLLQSPTSTACLVGCDTLLMNCQNTCIVIGPVPAIANPAGSGACAVSCTTQQLVCKNACNRSPQQ